MYNRSKATTTTLPLSSSSAVSNKYFFSTEKDIGIKSSFSRIQWIKILWICVFGFMSFIFIGGLYAYNFGGVQNEFDHMRITNDAKDLSSSVIETPHAHHYTLVDELHKRLDSLESMYARFNSKVETEQVDIKLGNYEHDQNYNTLARGEKTNLDALQKKIRILEEEKLELKQKIEDQMYHHLEHHADPESTMPWLIIGIPTIGRKDNKISYLGETISHLLSPLPQDPTDPMFGKVHLVVVNNHYLSSDLGSSPENGK